MVQNGFHNMVKRDVSEFSEAEKAAVRRFIGTESAEQHERDEAAPLACSIIAHNTLCNLSQTAKDRQRKNDLYIVYSRAWGPTIMLISLIDEGCCIIDETIPLACLDDANITYEKIFLNAISDHLGFAPETVGDWESQVPTAKGMYPFIRWKLPANKV